MSGRVIDTAILLLAGLFVLLALIYIVRGIAARNRSGQYYLQRQRARGDSASLLMQGVALLVVAVMLFAAYGFFQINVEAPAAEQELRIEPTPEVTVLVRTVQPTETPTPLPSPTPEPTETQALPSPEVVSATPTTDGESAPTQSADPPPEEPTPEATEVSFDATINVIGGLYLRDEPNGDIIVLLENGSGVFLLDGLIFEGGLDWRQVRTADGAEGWVADEFLQYNVQPEG